MKTSRLSEKYKKEIVPQLLPKYKNVMRIPRVAKVVVNMRVGDALQNSKFMELAVQDLTLITGQKPIITRAKKSIATFKLREGNPIGAKVTLRGERAFFFLDKLCNIVLPKVRDFRGLSPNAFDGRGNYTIGLSEQLVFPEISFDSVSKVRGMDITIVTTSKKDEGARDLLEKIGLPIRKG